MSLHALGDVAVSAQLEVCGGGGLLTLSDCFFKKQQGMLGLQQEDNLLALRIGIQCSALRHVLAKAHLQR